MDGGMLYENAISQMIAARGRKLYFYTRYSEEKHQAVTWLVARGNEIISIVTHQ